VFVRGFTKWFPNAAPFTQLPWRLKLRDTAGQKALVGQILGHSVISAFGYLPSYYVLKEVVAQRDQPPEKQLPVTGVLSAALAKYRRNFGSDNLAIQGYWIPADAIIFGLLPMWARMPVQHTTSLGWTMILSATRGTAEVSAAQPHIPAKALGEGEGEGRGEGRREESQLGLNRAILVI